MENTKSFGQNLAGTARICWTTVQLVWKASPVLLVAVLLLFVVQSGLAPLQLALSRAVIDSLAALAGRATALDPIVTRVPLAVWIALTLVVVVLGQLIAPLIAMLQSRIGDRLTGYITEQVMLNALSDAVALRSRSDLDSDRSDRAAKPGHGGACPQTLLCRRLGRRSPANRIRPSANSHGRLGSGVDTSHRVGPP